MDFSVYNNVKISIFAKRNNRIDVKKQGKTKRILEKYSLLLYNGTVCGDI